MFLSAECQKYSRDTFNAPCNDSTENDLIHCLITFFHNISDLILDAVCRFMYYLPILTPLKGHCVFGEEIQTFNI